MIKIIEIISVAIFLILLIIPIIVISILIKIDSNGPILYWSDRVGQNSIIFKMPKFRTMTKNTPDLPTHLFKTPDKYVTKIGKFLRKYSLDEIPQLLSILNGKMTFIGPRPALYNQSDLIELRRKLKIDQLKPGLTGWAQIKGRDNITIQKKVDYDLYYLRNKSIGLNIQIIFKTFIVVILKKNISH